MDESLAKFILLGGEGKLNSKEEICWTLARVTNGAQETEGVKEFQSLVHLRPATVVELGFDTRPHATSRACSQESIMSSGLSLRM